MHKIAYSYSGARHLKDKAIAKAIAPGAAIGGAVGGLNAYRTAKLNQKEGRDEPLNIASNKSKKGRFAKTVGGAISGAIAGGALGFSNHISKNLASRHQAKFVKSQGGKLKLDHLPAVATAGGGLLGAGLGSVSADAVNKAADKDKSKSREKIDKKTMTLALGLFGAAQSRNFAHMARSNEVTKKFRQVANEYRNKHQGAWETNWKRRVDQAAGVYQPKPPEWAKDVTTKAEAKKRYRAEALKHHPDRGGDVEKMKQVNNEWDDGKAAWFEKLSSADILMLLNSFYSRR